MKKSFIVLVWLLSTTVAAFSQELQVNSKTKEIEYRGSQKDTAKINYDLNARVMEWLRETAKNNNARGFSFDAKKNEYTGNIITILKYKDNLGVEQKFPLICTMNIKLIKSAVLGETTYKFELVNFDIQNTKKKYYPAEKLLIKGETDKNDPLPTEALFELQTQATSFIDGIITSFHEKMLAGLVAQN